MSRDRKEIPSKLFNIQEWIPDFLIDHGKRTALCFRETLMVCSKNEFAKDIKPVGGYCILVESIGPQTLEFLVHVQSSMSVDGHFGGTKVISSVTSKFHCLEEKRTEFLHEGDSLHEKSIYIGIEDNSYHVKLIRTCQCDQSEETKNLSFCCNDRFISEGVNILLMRYLALKNYGGTLSLQTITIDGELMTSNYNCTPSERMEIDGHFLNVYTVERKMYKQDGDVHTIKTHLTLKGRILRHNWLDMPYILKINPLADPTITDNIIRVETPLRDRWAEDIEMFSKYLDKKYSKMAEYTEYLADHPEVKQLITDYTQTLLVVKPESVIDFTIQHFKAFAKDPISWETSTEEENYNVDVQSQLAKEKSEIVCGACEFKIKSASLNETPSKSSMEECLNIVDSYNSIQSIQSYEASISKSSKSGTSLGNESIIHEDELQFEEICHKCHTILKVCDKQQHSSKCSGCLKTINICSKCSTIDQIMHMLKE